MYWSCSEPKRVVFHNCKIIVSIYFCKIYFVSVKGQSIEAPDSVVSHLGEPVIIKWTIVKDQTDRIVHMRLYHGKEFIPENVLTKGVQPLIKQALAEDMFGENMKTKFNDSFYYVTFDKWNLTKKTTFTLVVNLEVNGTLIPRPALNKSVEVLVVVAEKGMIFFFFFEKYLN